MNKQTKMNRKKFNFLLISEKQQLITKKQKR